VFLSPKGLLVELFNNGIFVWHRWTSRDRKKHWMIKNGEKRRKKNMMHFLIKNQTCCYMVPWGGEIHSYNAKRHHHMMIQERAGLMVLTPIIGGKTWWNEQIIERGRSQHRVWTTSALVIESTYRSCKTKECTTSSYLFSVVLTTALHKTLCLCSFSVCFYLLCAIICL